MKKQSPLLKKAGDIFFNVQEIGVIVPLVVCCLFFGLKSPIFFSGENKLSIASVSAMGVVVYVTKTLAPITRVTILTSIKKAL